MKLKSSPKNLINASSIAVAYLIISSLYIIISDKLVLFFFNENTSNILLNEVQSYKGLIFVVLSSFLIYVLLKKREQKTLEYISSLKKNQKQYLDLFKNMSHGVIYATPEGIVTSVNQSTLAILGITEKEMIGKSIFDTSWKPITTGGEIFDEYQSPTKRAIKNKKPERNHVVGVVNAKTGRYIWLKVNAIPEFENENVEPFRVCVTIDDITQLKKYQEELEESQSKIKESLQKTQFSEFLLKEASKLSKIGAYEVYENSKNSFFSDELYLLFGIPKDEKFPLERVSEVLTDKSEALLSQGVKNCMKFGSTMDEELEINMEDGKHLWVRITIKPIYDKQNKIVGRRGVVQDITESKKAQIEVETSLKVIEKNQRSIRQASELAKIGFWEYDSIKDVVTWSDYIFHIYGTDPNEGADKQKIIEKVFDNKSLQKLKKYNLDLMTNGNSYDIELRLINLKNQEFWIRNVVQPVYNKQNKVIGRRGVLQDITEYKRVQLQLENSLKLLEKSEYSFRQAGKMAKIGYWAYDRQTDVISWSDEIHNIYGTDPKDKVPKLEEILSFFTEKSKEKLINATIDLATKGTSFELELNLINAKNKNIWIRNLGEPVYNDNNEIIGRRGVSQNITAQKKAEEKILQSEQRFKALVQEGYDLFAIIDQKGYYTYMSPSSNKIIGVPPEEFVGKNAFEFVHPDDIEKAQNSIKKVVSQERIVVENYRAKNHKNEWRWVETVLTNMLNNEAVNGIVINSRDITDQVQQQEKIISAKEKAEENELKMKEAQKTAKLGSWYYDVINKVSYWSEETYNIWGFDPENTTIGFLDHQKRMSPKDWDRFNAVVDNATEKGIPYKMELELIMPDASKKIVDAIGKPVLNENNQVIAFKGTTQDITERIAIENELRSAKEKAEQGEFNMNQASKLAKIGYWYYDTASQTLTWSDYIYGLYNLTPEDDIPNYEVAKSFFDAKSQQKITKATKELDKNGTSYDLELRMINAKNEEIWVRNVVQPVYNDQNQIIGKRGIIQNITEDKHLRELNNDVAKMVRIGSWSVDLETQKVFWSKVVHEMHETDSKSYFPNLEEGINFYREDFREMVSETIGNSMVTGDAWDFEAVLVTAKKKEIWVRSIGNAEFIDGKCIRLYGGFQDINARKQSENRLISLSQNLPGIIQEYHLKKDGNSYYKNVGGKVEKIWGFTVDEVLGDKELINNQLKKSGSLELVKESVIKAIQTKSKWQCQYKYVMPKTGKIRTHLALGSLSFLADGTIVLSSIILDVTNEVKNEELLKQTTKVARIGSWEMDLVNQKGENMYWSPTIREVLEIDDNYTPTLTGGIEFHVGESKERIKKALKLLIEEGIEFDEEILMRTATGKECWARSIGKSEVINGKRTRIYGSYQDIHKQKTAAIELEKSLKTLKDYKYSLDQSAIITFADSKGAIISVNENFCKISGYKQEELIGKNHRIINSNYHSKQFFKELWETIETGKVWRGEVKNKAKDGSFFWVDTTIVPFLNDKNKPIQYLAIRFDITERKNAEQEKTRFQKTLENSLNEIYMFHPETYKFGYVNKGAQLNLGYTKEGLKKLTPLDIKPEYTLFAFNTLVAPLKNKKKDKVVFFTKHQRKDGSTYPVEVHLKLVEFEGSTNFIAIVLDITERKKAEKDLIISSERLRLATTSAKLGIWDWDLINDKLTWDEKMYELYGIKKSKFTGTVDTWKNALHPKDYERVNKDLENAIKGIIDFHSVFRVIWPDNSIHFIEARAIVSRNSSGKAIRIIGSNIDVTDAQKAKLEILKAKQQIEISEAKFKSYTEKSPIAIFTTDVKGKYTYVNETWLNLTGLVLEDALSSFGWLSVIHPDDVEDMNKNWYKSVKSKGKWKYEYRFINKKSNKIVWVEATVKEVFNEKNELTGYLGTNVNITERKKAEEMYRLLADNTNDIIALQEPDASLKYISPAAENLLGYQQEELLHNKFINVIHKDDIPNLRTIIRKKLLKGKIIEAVTYRAKHKNGNYVWLESLISPVAKGNKIISLVSTSRDITQGMLAKKEIEEYQTSLQRLTSEISLIEEKQKKEIAANIHDHLSQSLVISRMKIVDLEKKAASKEVQEDLGFIKNHISEALENSRKITYELSPPVLYQLGIIDALDWFADETNEKYGIEFKFNCNVTAIQISEFKSILLFRCVQECVTNTLKYAEASLITLDFIKDKDSIIVTLSDNGKGFDTSKLNKTVHSGSGFGLFAVKERIRNINGKLEITSKINIGTKIKFFVSLDA